MRKWVLRVFRVRVSWPSPIWQIRVPILPELTRITRSSQPNQASRTPNFSYPLVSSILLPSSSSISHSCPQLNHHRRTQSEVIPLYLSMTWSWVDTEYSIHRVQHPPKIVCLPFIHMITCWPLNVASASGVPPYTIDRHQPALHESLKVKAHCHIPTVAS